MTDTHASLRAVLDAAFEQSAHGKGMARHGRAGVPFEQQPILTIGRMVGPGYAVGQLMKKAQEAVGMVARCDHRAAVNELLGTIVYAAAAVVLITEHQAEFDRNVQAAAAEAEKERQRVAGGGLPAAPSKFETGVEKRNFTDAATRLREAADRIAPNATVDVRGWAPGDVVRDEVPSPVLGGVVWKR